MTCPDCNEIEAVMPGGICQKHEIAKLKKALEYWPGVFHSLKSNNSFLPSECYYFDDLIQFALKRSEG